MKLLTSLFFGIDPESSLTNIDASNIVVNITDPKQIAAASDPAYTNSDNTNIKKIIEIKDDISGVLTAAEETDLLSDGSITIGGITYNLTNTVNYNLIKEKSFHEFYSSNMVTPVSSELSKIKTLAEDSGFLLESIINVTDELLQTVLNLVK